MVKFPVLVSIMQTIPAYPSGSYELEVMGFGATLESADAAIAKCLAGWNAYEYQVAPGVKAPRAHRAAIRFACEACGVSGIEPGYKRKPCGRCGGKGAREVVS